MWERWWEEERWKVGVGEGEVHDDEAGLWLEARGSRLGKDPTGKMGNGDPRGKPRKWGMRGSGEGGNRNDPSALARGGSSRGFLVSTFLLCIL